MIMLGLVLAGITALPLRWEVSWLARLLGVPDSGLPGSATGLLGWIATVRDGLNQEYARAPFLAYGTDWLAFGHFVIALAFIGPIRDPGCNLWVVEWGMLACVLVIPMALLAGPIREIPLFHRLIDCSFGVFGFIPLALARRHILQLRTETSG